MNFQSIQTSCADDSQLNTIHIPCGLVERVEKFAKQRGNSLTGLVIEALDTFMRDQKVD